MTVRIGPAQNLVNRDAAPTIAETSGCHSSLKSGAARSVCVGEICHDGVASFCAVGSWLRSCSVCSSVSSYREYFDHWLVLELADGRLAYIPPTAVRYIEQASTGKK